MALQFALRPRLRLAEEPERARAVQLPPVALPVVAYWIVMGLLTYGVSRAPAWLDASTEAQASPAAFPRVPELPVPMAPPARTTRTARTTDEPRRESEPLPARAPAVEQGELAPTWKDTPPEAAPAAAPQAKVEPEATGTLAPSVREERRGDGHEQRAHRRRSMEPGTAVSETGAPSEWPLVPPLPAAPKAGNGDRDRVAMRSTLDDLWGQPGEDAIPRSSSRQEPRGDHAVPDQPAPGGATRAAFIAAGSRVATCESVLARATDEIDMTAGRGPRDLTREAYAAILERGSYLSACAVPAGTAVEVCAAVQNGRALGVTVISRPSDARVNACIRGSVASLAFPANARLDVTRTRFDAARDRRAP